MCSGGRNLAPACCGRAVACVQAVPGAPAAVRVYVLAWLPGLPGNPLSCTLLARVMSSAGGVHAVTQRVDVVSLFLGLAFEPA